MPPSWNVGLFGSAKDCPGVRRCSVGSSDVDLVLVHPVGLEQEAIEIRRRLASAFASRSLQADIVILSTQEVASTSFWLDEGVLDIESFLTSCGGLRGQTRDDTAISTLVRSRSVDRSCGEHRP